VYTAVVNLFAGEAEDGRSETEARELGPPGSQQSLQRTGRPHGVVVQSCFAPVHAQVPAVDVVVDGRRDAVNVVVDRVQLSKTNAR